MTTYTGVSGSYALSVTEGHWVVHVESPAYQLQWHDGKSNPLDADPIHVAGGARVGDIDFVLVPHPVGRVAGSVTGISGAPLCRALVVAVALDPGTEAGPAAARGAAAFTRSDGTYALHVEPGTYALGASVDWRTGPTKWWNGRPSLGEADPIVVSEDGAPVAAEFVLVAVGSPLSDE